MSNSHFLFITDSPILRPVIEHAENGFPAAHGQLFLSFYFDAKHVGIGIVLIGLHRLHRMHNDGAKKLRATGPLLEAKPAR